MKIKEVIAETGLTDRAIRLYIENGLVTPENQKSYTGRNNYNFTQADIDCFEQIAMLRKADFSLSDICLQREDWWSSIYCKLFNGLWQRRRSVLFVIRMEIMFIKHSISA